MRRWSWTRTLRVRAAALAALVASLSVTSPPVALAAGSVTNCSNDHQFANRVSSGGTVTFDCGAGRKTIVLTNLVHVTQSAVIDGGGLITLSGAKAHRLFSTEPGTTLTLRNITLTKGKGDDGGAIVNFGTLHLDHARITASHADGYTGGAIWNHGTLTAKHSQFQDNKADEGGAIVVYTGKATISDSSFDGNRALATDGSGGAILMDEGTTLHVKRSRFHLNRSEGYGGAIQTSYQSTTITVSESTFDLNIATNAGGAIYNGGDLTLTSDTFTTNGAGNGGGVFSNDILSATNVTFWHNGADMRGGALHASGAATLTNTTISDNTAGAPNATGTGGDVYQASGSMSFFSSIVAHAFQSDNCTLHGSAVGNDSLSTDGTCGFGAGQDNVSLTLGDPDTNGGLVPTIRLRKGSAPIDAGSANCAPTDARGVTRPKGPQCDMGAFEYQPCTGKPSAPTQISTVSESPTTAYTYVDVDWVGADCTRTYKVVVKYGGKNGTVYDSNTNLQESSHRTGALSTGYTWWLRITACNNAGCTSAPWRTFTT